MKKKIEDATEEKEVIGDQEEKRNREVVKKSEGKVRRLSKY